MGAARPQTMDTRPGLAPALRHLARALGLAVAALGVLVLVGWVAGVEGLTHLVPDLVPMRPNSALALVLGGGAASLAAARAPRPPARIAAQLGAAALAALAAATWVEHLTGLDLGVDRFLVRLPADLAGAHAGRIPFFGAAALLLLAVALMVLQRGRAIVAQALAAVAGLLPLQALVGFLYGVQARGGESPVTQVTALTGLGIALLAAAVLLARPDEGFVSLFAAAGPGGTILRRLLAPVVLIPLLLGWVFLVGGPRLGHYEALVGASFVVISAIATGAAIVWRNARAVEAADAERGRVEETLRGEREWLRRVEAERVVLLAREQAARAEAEAASRAKDEFIATLSHELRTPLNSVLGWSRLLRTGKLDAAGVRKAVEAIERGATTQAQIVDDLLDVSRIVRGELKLDVREVDLTPVVEAAVDTVRPAALAKEIEIGVRLARPGTVAGDPGRLQQVVWNLLSNAVKFTSPGGRVEVRLEPDGEGAAVVVSDSGQGISPEFLPHVFERFRQADSSTTRTHGGLGLGLAIARHLVEAHGGTVSVESAGPGLGSTFRVRLPPAPARIRRGRATPAPAPPPPAARPAPSLASLRVMVVDDDPDTLDSMKQLLELQGAEVTAAGSAEEALAAFERRVPDVLLSDIGMPGQDGYDLIRKVRGLGPERGGRVPAAAFTAYTQGEYRRAALGAGYQLFLPKPVEPVTLAEAVARLAGRA